MPVQISDLQIQKYVDYYAAAGLMTFRWVTIVFDGVAAVDGWDTLEDEVRVKIRDPYNAAKVEYGKGDFPAAARKIYEAYSQTLVFDARLNELAKRSPRVKASLERPQVKVFKNEYDQKRATLATAATTLGFFGAPTASTSLSTSTSASSSGMGLLGLALGGVALYAFSKQ